MKAATEGGHLPGPLLPLTGAEHLVQEPGPTEHVVITGRNRTVPFAFPHACCIRTRRGFYKTY